MIVNIQRDIGPDVFLQRWISAKTEGATTVVELGAGFFDKLAWVHPSVKKKIGIEIWEPYIKNAKYHDCEKIQGDIREYEKFLNPEDLDCVLLVDILEHFTPQEAVQLVSSLKNSFNKIVLMVPEGSHPQNEDVTGYGAHEYQSHRSIWRAQDLDKLGFHEVLLDSNFHHSPGKDSGCLFASWEKAQCADHADSADTSSAPIKSNLEHWKNLQSKDYFENHDWYGKLYNGLKVFGDDLERISRYVELEKNMILAVIGSGYGRESALFAPHVKHVYGIDVSEAILNKSRLFLTEKEIYNFTPVLAENWEKDIKVEIDFAYCVTVFQHLTRDLTQAYLDGFSRKLSKTGKMLCQFALNPEHTFDAELKDYEPNVGWTRAQIKDAINRSELKVYSLVKDERFDNWFWAFFGR